MKMRRRRWYGMRFETEDERVLWLYSTNLRAFWLIRPGKMREHWKRISVHVTRRKHEDLYHASKELLKIAHNSLYGRTVPQ